MVQRFSIDMDGSMEPDEAGQWVLYEDAVKLREPAQQGPVPRRVAECLVVLRPTVKGKFPQEQALDELVGHLTSPQAQQPPPVQEPVAWAWNPAKESWEQVHMFGHWQQGAIYAFGPEAPQAQHPLPSQVTEAMHRAACKVLLRASGLDGLPQRMLDAMRATAPQAQQPGKAVKLSEDEIAKAWSAGEHNASAATKRRITGAIQDAFIAKNGIEQ